MTRIWLIILLALGAPSVAQESVAPPTGLIGRVGTSSTCSAFLVGREYVVTAAHCLSPKRDGYHFRLGVEDSVTDTFAIERFLRHPRYQTSMTPILKQRYDMALAQLATPVPEGLGPVIPVGEPAQVGETLYMESWRRHVSDLPQRRPCEVLGGADAFQVTLACKVVKGESGAPVFRFGPDGPEFVAVVTAKAVYQGTPVALAASAEHHFGLIEAFALGD
ncbi:MAG: trypsin-like serine protease [Pseudomonadota bacterium]